PAVPTTGYEDVKRIALARLVVDNVPSIQVDWSLYGPKLAQVALTVGADDVDGVSPEDDMGEGRRRAPLEEIPRNIVAAGQGPGERNRRFDLVYAWRPFVWELLSISTPARWYSASIARRVSTFGMTCRLNA